jgi:hypothetical protein
MLSLRDDPDIVRLAHAGPWRREVHPTPGMIKDGLIRRFWNCRVDGLFARKGRNPAASRSPDRHRWQAPPDPRLKPRKNTHFHLLKDASHTLRMEQPRPLDGSKVQTLVNLPLPAPFGPISAWTVPRLIFRLTFLTAKTAELLREARGLEDDLRHVSSLFVIFSAS